MQWGGGTFSHGTFQYGSKCQTNKKDALNRNNTFNWRATSYKELKSEKIILISVNFKSDTTRRNSNKDKLSTYRTEVIDKSDKNIFKIRQTNKNTEKL